LWAASCLFYLTCYVLVSFARSAGSIFDGTVAILSVVESLHHHNQPGYVVSLDFFHDYDRIDLKRVDRVLQAFCFDAT
jgi:hypothetical protein